MSKRTIAVVGENLVDLFVDGAGAVTPVPGGGPFNVARTIARLGQSAVLFSGVSTDEFGRVLQSALKADGVRLALPRPINFPTSLAIVEVTNGGPRYRFHLNGTAAFQLDEPSALAAFNALGDDVAALYIGTLGLLVEPMASAGESLVNAASPSTLVVLDPNCRPSAITDHDGYRGRLARLFRRSDVVKVSTEDLAYLSPDSPPEEAAHANMVQGTRCVIVTDGPDQVHVYGSDFSLSVDVPTVSVIDTVGAGDALVGGFLAWWIGHDFSRLDVLNRRNVRAGIEAAVKIASNTCTRRGAEPPWAHEVEATPGWEWL